MRTVWEWRMARVILDNFADKGLGSPICRIGPANRQKIKFAERKWHSTFCVLNISAFMSGTYIHVLYSSLVL